MKPILQPGKIMIGTSGLVLPGPKKTFPDQFQSSSRLHYYSTLFNSIEINSSFYRLHKAGTYKKWSNEVLEGFTFTVKLWKDITHKKVLAFSDKDLKAFIATLSFPKDKQGCILIQFPASIRIDSFEKVEHLLSLITNLLKDQSWNLCVEFRDKSWYSPGTVSMLKRFDANIVYHDIGKSSPSLDTRTSQTIYLRFHGPEAGYRGSYTTDFLDEYAKMIREWNAMGKHVFAYFNNTLGQAFNNAAYLAGKVASRSSH